MTGPLDGIAEQIGRLVHERDAARSALAEARNTIDQLSETLAAYRVTAARQQVEIERRSGAERREVDDIGMIIRFSRRVNSEDRRSSWPR